MKQPLTYRFETPVYPGNILYVNVIERYSCTNNCRFCSRPRDGMLGDDNIYEKKAGGYLYLPKTPTLDEVMKSIDANIKEDDKEIAIIGLGEPLFKMGLILPLIKNIKEKYDIRTRVDTNGALNCIGKDLAKGLEYVGLDEIRISLNAINEKEYNALCRPDFLDTYLYLLDFIQDCNVSSIDTFVSFVVDFVDEKTGIRTKTKEEYIEFAKSLDIEEDNVIIRKFIPPIE
ncbi:radical SAM protein [Candidatus Woesearchaeota archaeon]|jgi:TatD family-associated radical SAM protein|nr:radical SAM protein [Candidatus Woesearchaeota archaeon]